MQLSSRKVLKKGKESRIEKEEASSNKNTNKQTEIIEYTIYK
jgi:hypothetical protein